MRPRGILFWLDLLALHSTQLRRPARVGHAGKDAPLADQPLPYVAGDVCLLQRQVFGHLLCAKEGLLGLRLLPGAFYQPRQLVHHIVGDLLALRLRFLNQLEQGLLVGRIGAGIADGDSPALPQLAMYHLVEDAGVKPRQRHAIGRCSFAHADAMLVQLLRRVTGIAEELGRVQRRSPALGNVLQGSRGPCRLRIVGLYHPRPDMRYAIILRQLEAVVAVDHVDPSILGIAPNADQAGQLIIPAPPLQQVAHSARVCVQLVLEAFWV